MRTTPASLLAGEEDCVGWLWFGRVTQPKNLVHLPDEPAGVSRADRSRLAANLIHLPDEPAGVYDDLPPGEYGLQSPWCAEPTDTDARKARHSAAPRFFTSRCGSTSADSYGIA